MMQGFRRTVNPISACLFYLVYDSLESFGVVDSEVSEHLTVDLDTGLVQCAHQLAVAHVLQTCSGIDTLNPECT